MLGEVVFNVELKKKKKALFNLDKYKNFIQPGMMSSLTPRSPRWSNKRLKKKEKMVEEGPDIVTLGAKSKDLISPFSLRSKDYAKISGERTSREMILPRMPPSQIRLRPLKKKKDFSGCGGLEKGFKSTFLRITKMEYCRAELLKSKLNIFSYLLLDLPVFKGSIEYFFQVAYIFIYV